MAQCNALTAKRVVDLTDNLDCVEEVLKQIGYGVYIMFYDSKCKNLIRSFEAYVNRKIKHYPEYRGDTPSLGITINADWLTPKGELKNILEICEYNFIVPFYIKTIRPAVNIQRFILAFAGADSSKNLREYFEPNSLPARHTRWKTHGDVWYAFE